MSVNITVMGDYGKTTKYLKEVRKRASLKFGSDIFSRIELAAIKTVEILKRSTPVNTGRAAESWGYEITPGDEKVEVTIFNTDIENGYNVALLIEYDHATRGGGWVMGRHYIEPSVKAGFGDVLDTTWKELTNI